jgi:hypothetical protein
MDTIEIKQVNVALKHKASACQYLGASSDSTVCFGFASPDNYCFQSDPPEAIRISYQENVCLSGGCTGCPVYRSHRKGPLPDEIRADSQRSGRGLSKLLMLVIGAGALLFGMWYAASFFLGADRPTLAEAQSAPPAGIPTLASQSASSNSQPTQILAVIPPSPTPTITAVPTQVPTVLPTFVPTLCSPPEDWVAYTVRPGDTLAEFRHIYGLNKSKLLAANCTPALAEVVVGQIFYLPYLPPTPVPVIVIPIKPNVPQNPTPEDRPTTEPPVSRP